MSERLKVLLGALGGAILALLLVGSLSGGGMGHSKMGGGLFSPLFVLLFWALVVPWSRCWWSGSSRRFSGASCRAARRSLRSGVDRQQFRRQPRPLLCLGRARVSCGLATLWSTGAGMIRCPTLQSSLLVRA